MAVQKKTGSSDKPKKKEINWMQVGVVAFCVLVVVMCIISFSNIPNLFSGNNGGTSSNVPAQAGYPVQVNATMYVGNVSTFTGTFALYAGTETNESVYLSSSAYQYPLVMYADEYNQISNGVIGLYPGQSTTVAGSGSQLAYTYTKDAINAQEIGATFDELQVGTELYLTETYKDELEEDASAIRIGVVTQKTDDMVVIQYGSDTINIELVGYVQTSGK